MNRRKSSDWQLSIDPSIKRRRRSKSPPLVITEPKESNVQLAKLLSKSWYVSFATDLTAYIVYQQLEVSEFAMIEELR